MRSAVEAVLAALLLASGQAAEAEIDRALPSYTTDTEVFGELRVAGGDTMRPLVESWARRFRVLHPHAAIGVDSHVSLSADGFAALIQRRVDLVTFVREPFPAELTSFKRKFGYLPSLISVANGSYATKGGTHALAIFVNSANPLTGLTLPQLDAILSASRRRGAPETLNTWGQLGLGCEWRGRPIHVYGMIRVRGTGNPPGVVNFMQQRVLLGGEFRSDLREEADRPGATALEAIVQAVAADADGIGYSGFGFETSGTRTVALGEGPGTPFYAGTPAEVAQGLYPLSRQIYLGFDGTPGRPLPPLIREFIRFALSREGQQEVARSATGFLPLTAVQASVARRQLE